MRSDNPEAFPSLDPISSLRSAVSRVGGARWAVGTTFEIGESDSGFVDKWIEEAELSSDTLVLVDPHVWSRVLQAPPTMCRTVPAAIGVHAKVLLVRGPDGVACQVGSANLTRSGLGGINREIVWTATANRQEGPQAAARDLAVLLLGLVSKSRYRLSNRWTDRLSEVLDSLPVSHPGSTRLLDNCSRPLWDQLLERVSRSKLSSVLVLSPYLSPEPVQAISKVARLRVIVPSMEDRRKLYEPKRLERYRSAMSLLRHEGGRFTHAKIYLLNRRDGSAMLAVGSANCTSAGLMRRAGKVDDSRVEALLIQELGRVQARQLEAGLETVPFAGKVEGPATDDQDEQETLPGLIAWCHLESVRLEIAVSSDSRPDGILSLRGPGRREWALGKVGSDGYTEPIPGIPEWDRARERGMAPSANWEVRWGGLRGPVIFLLGREESATDLARLWDFDSAGASGGGGRCRGDQRPGRVLSVQPDGSLDQYERRSERVCLWIRGQLRRKMPEDLGQIRSLWDERPTLDCDIPARVFIGAKCFLAARLVAALKSAPSPSPSVKRLISDLLRESRSAARICLPAVMSGALRSWSEPGRWPEDKIRWQKGI